MEKLYKVLFIVAVVVSTSSAFPLLTSDETSIDHPNTAMVQHQNARLRRESESFVDSIEERVRIVFDQLPNGTQIESVIGYLPGALGVYYSLARGFIDTVLPGPLPYDVFTGFITDFADGLLPGGEPDDVMGFEGSGLVFRRQALDPPSNGPETSLPDVAKNFVKWMVSALVVFVLGLLLAVCFPVVALCFCCCRLCGKCGGKTYKYRSKNQTIKCIIPTVILVLSGLLLLVGIILGFLSNEKISDAVKSYTGTADAAVQDTINYIKDTADEVIFIADNELDLVFETANNDIENIGSILGSSIETALENEAAPFLNSTRSLLDEVDSINTGLMNINRTVNELMSLSTTLNSSISDLQQALSNLTTLCAGNPTCESMVPSMETVEIALDWNDVADVTSALSVLEGVDVSGTRELVDNSTMLFENVTGQIDEHFADFELPLNISQLDIVDSIIDTVQNFAGDSLTADNGTIGSIRNAFDQGEGYISMFDTYRYGLGAAIFLVVVLILVVFTLGIICGIFGYSQKALPYERTSVAHAGAIMLLIGVALCFLTCGLLLVISSFMYFLSTGVQKFCNDLAPSEYVFFQRVLDDPDVWDGNTLIGRVLNEQFDISSNLNVSTVLRQCEENAPLYQALQVEQIFDIEALLSNISNLTDVVNLDDLDIDSFLTVSSSNIVPDSIRQNLEGLQSNVSNSINFTEYQQFLNSSVVTFDLQGLVDNLTSLAAAFNAVPNAAAANETILIRDMLVSDQINTTLMEIAQQTDYGLGNITNVETALQGINVTQVFSQLDDFLNRTVDIVTDEVDAYVDQVLGYFTDFVDFAINAVQYEVGRCGPLSAAYQGIHSTICDETLDGVNGFWFSIGWCVLFLIPMLICGAIVTNYIRRAPSDITDLTKKDKWRPEHGTDVITNPGAVAVGYRPPVHPEPQRIQSPHVPISDW